MKTLVCDLCGGQNLVKQDGVFVCQDCGTKYSVEEARKMMREVNDLPQNPGAPAPAPAPAAGNSGANDRLANLYALARRAKEDNNSENAAKYYEMILLDDPMSWEASFYSVYYQAMSCKIGEIRSAANSVSNCLDNVVALVRDQLPEKGDRIGALSEIVLHCCVIAPLLKNAAKSHYNGIGDSIRSQYTQEYVDRACASRDILYNCGDAIEKVFGDDPDLAQLAVDPWKQGIEMHRDIMSYLLNSSANNAVIATYTDKIGRYDKEFLYQSLKKKAEEKIEAAERKRDQMIPDRVKIRGGLLTIGVLLTFFALIMAAMGASLKIYASFYLYILPLAAIGIFCLVKSFKNQSALVESTMRAKEQGAAEVITAQQELADLNARFGK